MSTCEAVAAFEALHIRTSSFPDLALLHTMNLDSITLHVQYITLLCRRELLTFCNTYNEVACNK